MAYLLVASLYQSKYASLENGPTSQYSMKDIQYHKDLVSAAYITKIHWHDDSGTMKNRAQDNKTRIFRG